MHYLKFIFICFFILYSCSKDSIINENLVEYNSINTTSRSINNYNIYDTLKNPYEINHIKNVVNSVGGDSSLYLPNKLYVRFLPKDTNEINLLINIDNLELFDYPLNIDFGEADEYIYQQEDNNFFTWKYTVVPANYTFRDIEYEIIEQCYLPEDDEAIANSRNPFGPNLEELAFKRLGYNLDSINESRSQNNPSGYVTFEDNQTNRKIPLKGIKIRCHTFIKWSTTYTDENGKYTMSSKFIFGPHYAIVFDNCKGFDIYKNWTPIARANFNAGWHSISGYDINIKPSSTLWPCAVINNAGYDYYNMCDSLNIAIPPKNLVIWAYDNIPSAAPMLNHNKDFIKANGHSQCANFFINMGLLIAQLNPIVVLLKNIAPDINIKTEPRDYKNIYKNTFHELSHASHYSIVGNSFWSRYISYIITYGNSNSFYGDGHGKDSELCAIGEMWGYFIGYCARKELESPITPDMDYPGSKYWFSPEIYWNLYRSKILTKREIFKCMKPNIDTYNKLLNELRYCYPGQIFHIEKEFYNNGICMEYLNFNFNEIFQSLYIPNNRVIYGYNPIITDGYITNNSLLEIGATETVTICSPFTVSSGSSIIIY